MQWPRAKTAIRSWSTTSSWPMICLAIWARSWPWTDLSSSSSARSGSAAVAVLNVASPFSEDSPLEHGEILERELEDRHGDRGAVDLADPVAAPRPVAALHGEELVAGLREVG